MIKFMPFLAWRILRRAKSRSVDCSADDKPEETRAQEAPAIVEQNSRERILLPFQVRNKHNIVTLFSNTDIQLDSHASGGRSE